MANFTIYEEKRQSKPLQALPEVISKHLLSLLRHVGQRQLLDNDRCFGEQVADFQSSQSGCQPNGFTPGTEEFTKAGFRTLAIILEQPFLHRKIGICNMESGVHDIICRSESPRPVIGINHREILSVGISVA